MRSLSDTVKCSATLFTIQKKHFIDQQRNMNWLSELAQKEYELSSLTRTVELLFFFFFQAPPLTTQITDSIQGITDSCTLY